MSFFKKFKANFNLKNPKNRKSEKKEAVEVQCLKYKIISEFTEEQVFNRNPRHFPEQHFTPTQHRKLQTKSLSENELHWQRLAKEKPQENRQSNGEVKNIIWPSESEPETKIPKITNIKKNKTNLDGETETQELNEGTGKTNIEESEIEVQQPTKSILKSTKAETKKEDHIESTKGKVNFGFQKEEEGSYERFEKIDDYLVDNDMYFSNQIQEDEKELYVVHTVNYEQNNSFSKNEYEQKVGTDEEPYDELSSKPRQYPIYNMSTHPKLNPTSLNINGIKKGSSLNTFEDTQKHQNTTGYSNQATNIFFDSDDESGNGSEMSA